MPARSLLLRLGPVVVLVSTLAMSMGAVGAQETPGLRTETFSEYRAYPDEGRVEVQFDYRFENTAVDVVFPGFFESLPTSARDVTATGPDGELVLVPLGETDGFTVWFVGFAEELAPGEETNASVEWVVSDGLRESVPIIEVGAVSIEIYVPGPEGSIWHPAIVELPSDFVPVSAATTGEVVAADDEERVRLPAATDAPYALATFSYVSRDRFVERSIDGPPEITIADWATTSRWSATVADRAATVISALDTWFGPRATPLEIRHGFASGSHPLLALDELEPFVVVESEAAASVDHQLAHGWLADVPVDEPWFIEGLAAAFAGDRPDPADRAEIVAALADEIGASGVRAVVEGLRMATITYPGVGIEAQPLPPDWRTLLDLLEGVGGSTGASALFSEAVVDVAGVAAIDRRGAALVDYRALEDRAGTWALPPMLRLPMASWDFDTFLARQAEVSDTLLQRDGIAAWADDLALDPRHDAQTLFESATADMVEVDGLLREQLEALEAFAEAERLVNGDRGLLARVGLARSEPDADLARLRELWAAGDYAEVAAGGHDLAELVEGAVGQGTLRILFPTVIVVALWQLVRWVIRRRGGDQVVDEA